MRTRIPLEGWCAGTPARKADGPRKAVVAAVSDSVGPVDASWAVVSTWHATQRATSLATFELADAVRRVARRAGGR